MQNDCAILDIAGQHIHTSKNLEAGSIEIEYSGWTIALAVKELNNIDTEGAFISPFSILFFKYQQKRKENALWVFVSKEHIFLVTFKEQKPLFSKIEDGNKSLQDSIEHFLRDFYNSKKGDFIEEIYIYYLLDGFDEDKNLQEQILLPVNYEKIDLKDICANPALTKYFIHYKGKSKEKKGSLSRYVLIGGGVLALGLILYDIYLKLNISSLKEDIKESISNQVRVANENNLLKTKILHIKSIKPIVMEILDNNSLISSKLKNIFDIVPDDTYFTYLKLDKDSLTIEGYTKNRASFIQNIHSKLSRFYQNATFTIKKEGELFKFDATYKDLEDE